MHLRKPQEKRPPSAPRLTDKVFTVALSGGRQARRKAADALRTGDHHGLLVLRQDVDL
jgi:hypothetical protein